MACESNVLLIQNPLWNGEAEQGEAAYGKDFDTKVGLFDRLDNVSTSLTWSAPVDIPGDISLTLDGYVIHTYYIRGWSGQEGGLGIEPETSRM